MKVIQIIALFMFAALPGYATERVSPSNCGWLGCGPLPTKEQIQEAVKIDPAYLATFDEGANPQNVSIMLGRQETLLDPILVYAIATISVGRWASIVYRCGKLEYVDPNTAGGVRVGEIVGVFTWGDLKMCNAPGFPWFDNQDSGPPGPRRP